MYTEDPHTANTHNAPWNLASSTSVHSAILPVAEVDEDEHQQAFHPFMNATRDNEQALSSQLLSQDAHQSTFPSPSSVPASLADSASSASPAAAFLSFFHSPSPAPETRQPDDEGNIVAGYTLGPIVGYGSTSIIRRASSSSGTTAAVKIVRRADLVKAGNAPQARKRLQHEAAVWATLTHEHILPLFSTVHTPYADYFFTLFCPAGSLFDILKRDGTPALLQDDAGMMFRQVVRGLRYLHEVACYVHRDIKLENVLVDEMGTCKIGDFGMSRRIGSPDGESDDDEGPPDLPANFSVSANGALHRAVSLAAPARRAPKGNFEVNHPVVRHNSARHRNSTSTNEPTHTFQPGSLPYAAPEILLPQTSDATRPHPSQDIWALGIMLYALLTGRLPFSDSFEPRLRMKILNGSYQTPDGIGRGAERILQGCLERSPADRWTIAMVDEVAWGVGWGAEGDFAQVARDEDGDTHTPSVIARSKSHSRPADLALPSATDADWPADEPHAQRPSMDAAARRSSSRAQRSLSRAPIAPTHRPGSATRRSPSRRSTSRRPRSPSHARTSPALTSPALATASSSSSFAFRDESALEVSPSPPASLLRSRGRRGDAPAHSASRSPSPSVVPPTPPDGARVASPALALLAHGDPDELMLDQGAQAETAAARGRQAVRTALGKPPLAPPVAWRAAPEPAGAEMGEDDGAGTGVERVDVDMGWRARPTSSPPVAPRAPLGHAALSDGATGGQDAFLRPCTGGAMAAAAGLCARSRSAGAGH